MSVAQMAWNLSTIKDRITNDLKASLGGDWKRSDAIALVALLTAGVGAYFSYSVARTAQLSERRHEVRSEAAQIINAYQEKLSYFNCYFIALGKPIDEKNPQLLSLNAQIDKMRSNLDSLDGFDNDTLDVFQSYLNKIPGKADRDTDSMIREIRAKMSKSQLDGIDSICTLHG